VKSPEDVEEVADLRTLGAIERMKGDRNRGEIYRLTALLYPRSSAAEAYRMLRTNIEFASLDGPIRTLLVTSSAPGDGKTVTAANLAVVFAQAGRRVLLVDADLRKPGVHQVFDLPNSRGLTTFLGHSDEVSLDLIANATEQANLRVLTSGPLVPNPAELLGSQRMRTILDRLKAGDDDLLIFDSPPLELVTDSAILGSYLDRTLLVIDAGRSRRRSVSRGHEALVRGGANILGVVLNRVPSRVPAGYADYYRSEEGPKKRVEASGATPAGRSVS
jgi:non-specific protein-tyrosine kinase